MYQMSVGLCSGIVTVTVAVPVAMNLIRKDPEAVHLVAVIH